MVDRNRGQALTLEAVTAGLLLLAAVGFALQMTAVTPLSASTSSQHLENQLESTGEGLLASTAETGSLKTAVLYWNETRGFHNNTGEESYYWSGDPPNEFGAALNETYGDRNIAYNVIVHYQTADGSMERQRMVYQGEPSDHAVSASQTITLVDDDRLVDYDGSLGPELWTNNDFYAPDAGTEATDDRPLYNVVRVEVIAWRI